MTNANEARNKLNPYYISGEYYKDDFEERFEKIIDAKSKEEAKEKLADFFDFDKINIDQCYETSSDAMI